MKLPIHAARVFDTPLMIDVRKAMTILRAVGHRFSPNGRFIISNEGVLNIQAGIIGDELGQALETQGREDILSPMIAPGIAKIDIEGTLVHKGKWIGMDSGETSYEGIQAQVQYAMRDDRIKGVIFEVDSSGGQVSGAFDTAAMIKELSDAKPTIAILTEDAMSAGYLLASAARKIVATETSQVGSIGVIAVHVDESEALKQDGLAVTLIYSGAHKADGNPYEALPKEVADRMRSQLDNMRDKFAAYVGDQRGERMTKQQALDTEAKYFNADDALALGLIDAIGRPGKAAEAFARAVV